MNINRRNFILSAAAAITVPVFARADGGKSSLPKFEACSLADVSLSPGSAFRHAVDGNRNYLLRIDSDRLLHNFRVHAGLKPKGEAYGGWEADTIAGHSLGHYLTALALMHAQTKDAECLKRTLYIVDELRECQLASGDGYVSGFQRRIGDKTEDGKVIFPEIMRGDIRAQGFNLNGSWVPFYTWHKLFAGLYAAQDFCGSAKALAIATDLAGYIGKVFDALTDAQVQTMLNCEHGGMNESMAELYARTKNKRWLALAERIRHNKTLGPMFAKEDKLPGLHANTQIPKVVGLARLFELTGKEEYRTASRFFWDNVTQNYSYVIGGNSDREHFPAKGTLSKYVTDQTCESCNTYNMLRLTRKLFADNPEGYLFDYYERAHFNHMLAHQNPYSGHFAYMIPLQSGAARDWSTDFNDFWCCVGTGMETHSKHGESIFWKAKDHLLVNLFIASKLDWKEKKAKVSLATSYPYNPTVNVTIDALAAPSTFGLSIRVPRWAKSFEVSVNGVKVETEASNGYATVRRKWKKGDALSLTLNYQPRIEPIPGDDSTVAILHGPLVLAADLGPADKPFDGTVPALVGDADIVVKRQEHGLDTFAVPAANARPGALELLPFFSLWTRRTAVYFKKFDEAGWKSFDAAAKTEAARLADLESRSLDFMRLGDLEAEKAHDLKSKISYDLKYRLRPGRDARSEGFFEFKMKCDPAAPQRIQATYWGEEGKRVFYILVDGTKIATENLGYKKEGEFVEKDYEIPAELTKGKSSVVIRFEPEKGHTAGPVFGVRLFR